MKKNEVRVYTKILGFQIGMKVKIRSLLEPLGEEIATITYIPLRRDLLYVVKTDGGIFIPLHENEMEAVEVK